MSLYWNRSPADIARADLDAAQNRRHRWNRTVNIAAGCLVVDVIMITTDLAVGVPFWWTYAVSLVSLGAALVVGEYAWRMRRRADRAVQRARHDLAHAERHSDGPQDADPDDDRDWGPYR